MDVFRIGQNFLGTTFRLFLFPGPGGGERLLRYQARSMDSDIRRAILLIRSLGVHFFPYPALGSLARNPIFFFAGEILREHVLPALGLSVSEAARRLGFSRQQLHRVLACTHPITIEMALRIGKFAGNGPALWLRLQQAHDLWHTARRMKSELTKLEPEKEARY